MAQTQVTETTEKPISLRLYPEQKKKLKQISKRVRLSEQDCLRKAIDFGLPILKKTILAAQAEPESAQ